MNSQIVGLRVAAIVFALFALGHHLVRLLTQSEVIVGVLVVPLWISWPLLVIAAAHSFLDVETLFQREQMTGIQRQAIK